MDSFQVSMLFGAAAFSLISMVVAYLLSLFALSFFLRPKSGALRLAIGFILSWSLTSVYLLFKSVSYYMQHSGEMYIAEIIFSVIILFIVTKLFSSKVNAKAV